MSFFKDNVIGIVILGVISSIIASELLGILPNWVANTPNPIPPHEGLEEQVARPAPVKASLDYLETSPNFRQTNTGVQLSGYTLRVHNLGDDSIRATLKYLMLYINNKKVLEQPEYDLGFSNKENVVGAALGFSNFPLSMRDRSFIVQIEIVYRTIPSGEQHSSYRVIRHTLDWSGPFRVESTQTVLASRDN